MPRPRKPKHLTQDERDIIKLYADSDMLTSVVAKKLFMHRNSIEYHLKQIQIKTGLNPKRFYDLIKLLDL